MLDADVQQPDLLLIEFIPLGFRQAGAMTDAPIAERNRGIPKLVAQLKRIIRVEFVHAAVLYYRGISTQVAVSIPKFIDIWAELLV